MKNITISLYCIVFMLSSAYTFGKSGFVTQIPNGSINSCATCHISNTNYSLNPFGSAIKPGFMNSGKVTWKSALAKLDSDGDGFSNGIELQDPDGIWTIGSVSPGDAGKVSNPGVKGSIPTSVNEAIINSVVFVFPNPASDYIEISTDGWTPPQRWSPSERVQIFNTLGLEINSTPSASLPHLIDGNLRIDISKLPAGVYFVRIGERVEKFVKM